MVNILSAGVMADDGIAFHSLSVTQKDFFLFRLRPLVAIVITSLKIDTIEFVSLGLPFLFAKKR